MRELSKGYPTFPNVVERASEVLSVCGRRGAIGGMRGRDKVARILEERESGRSLRQASSKAIKSLIRPAYELMIDLVLPANILAGFRMFCPNESLEDWVERVPNWQSVRDVAAKVHQQLCSARRVLKLRRQPPTKRDPIFENISLFASWCRFASGFATVSCLGNMMPNQAQYSQQGGVLRATDRVSFALRPDLKPNGKIFVEVCLQLVRPNLLCLSRETLPQFREDKETQMKGFEITQKG
ncbi:hypothetical protein R3P38DRAFT_2815236 [Favolaschia claudopus]|uniref:DUF6589 domain-containing protein n=1 Tax=Favolaschia claudopus TaxID=2862362 RepID=A0AAV9Z1R0_9AGAR